MNIKKLSNGNLLIEADPQTKVAARTILKMDLNGYAQEAAFLAYLMPIYQQTAPCSVGCLTSAPLITDGTNVWGYMDYQINSFLTELAEGREVVWAIG
jgi:hypothetical protein